MPISKTFCYNAFTGLDIGTYGRIRPCCKFDTAHIPYFDINQGISQYRNSSWLKNLQYQFIQGKKPAGCARCWKEEDAGIKSRRQLDYQRHKQKLTDLNLREKDFVIVGVAFNNLCNLACRICGPWASSSWVSEHNKQNPGSELKASNWHKTGKNINELYEYSKNACIIEIVGGEPFLSDFTEHYDFLSKFVEAGNSQDVILHYITNATVFPGEKYKELWQYFKEVEIQLSIDDIEHRFEYNRWPANWDSVYKNIKAFQFYADTNNNISLGMSYTVSAFTIAYAAQFAEWCSNEGLPEPWYGLVNKRDYYHPGVLDVKIKDNIKKTLLSSNLEKVQNLANYLFVRESDMEWFLSEVKKLDHQRDQDFHKTFPELAVQ